MFAGAPTGYDEIWVIGDTHLLVQLGRALEALKQADSFDRHHTKEPERLIYLLNNYEVIFGTFHHSWSFTMQIKGGLNYLLSMKWKLPNHIYIVFSNDQIQDSEILGDQLYPVLMDLFTTVSRAIEDCKILLPKKARRSKPPSITVVKTVPKSEQKQHEANFKNKRRTLNRALQKVASDFKWRTLNVDDILPRHARHFDDRGEDLSDEGLSIFWRFLSENLKFMDTPNNLPSNKKQTYRH